MDIGETYVNVVVMKDVKTHVIRLMVNVPVRMDTMEVRVIILALITAKYAILKIAVVLAEMAFGEIHAPNANKTVQIRVTKYLGIALVKMDILEVPAIKPALKTAKHAILIISVRYV